MAPVTDDDRTSDPVAARTQAAALFAAAARNERAGTATQLHCLAASSALRGVPSGPVPATTDAHDPDQLITQALRILGELEPEDFADPDVLAAARHGRRALREPR